LEDDHDFAFNQGNLMNHVNPGSDILQTSFRQTTSKTATTAGAAFFQAAFERDKLNNFL